MPEGPELHLASVFVNTACAGVIFTGAVEKSEVSKQAQVQFASDAYQISATSRGKEVRLSLTPVKTETRKGKSALHQAPMDVVFRFGMSGRICFTAKSELPKHAHLRFYTKEDPQRVLSFVDPRRFGSWQANGNWHKDRGPCVISEYERFRENVLSNLEDKAFNRPVCEALLNQKYFNGIGNYLRAEILYRLNIPPFVKARNVLEGLKPQHDDSMSVKKEPSKVAAEEAVLDETKIEHPDLLSLCHTVPLEVINLGGNGYEPQKGDYTKLVSWLQCYSIVGMKTLADHNGRTVWFKGNPGPMAPKASRTFKAKRKIKDDAKKEKHVKKEPGAGKSGQDVPNKQSGTRRKKASKPGSTAGANVNSKRPKADQRQSRTKGVQQPRNKKTKRPSIQKDNTKAKATSKPLRKSSRIA